MMSELKVVTITAKIELIVPRVPNYISHKMLPGLKQDGFKEGPKTHIKDLSDEHLTVIANEWRSCLLHNAQVARNEGG